MQQPEAVPITPEALRTIAALHGADPHSCGPLSTIGNSNTLYALGDALILRVPRNIAPRIAGVRAEALAARAAYDAGVRTARLVGVDESLTILPVPYTIYERINGVPLEHSGWTVTAVPQTWRAVGADLALLHSAVSRDGPAGRMEPLVNDPDPRPWLEHLHTKQLIDSEEQKWLLGWLERLGEYLEARPPARFCHGDLNAGNILVDAASMRYLGIIDWDAAGWSDYVWDFVRVSLRVVPWILDGYERISPLDPTAEARLLWHYLQGGIFWMRFKGADSRHWTRQRVAGLRGDLEKFLDTARAAWLNT